MTGLAFIAIVAVYVAIAGGVTYGLTKLAAKPSAKWAIGLVSIFGFVALATWDEVWGYVRLRHLCTAEGGIRVYKTVALAPEYWKQDGSPNFAWRKDGRRIPFAGDRYQIESSGSTIHRWPATVRYEYKVVDRQSNERLAEYRHFRAAHGWLLDLASAGAHVQDRACHDSNVDIENTLVLSTFRRPATK